MNQKHPYLILTAFIVLSFATSALGGTIVYANLQPWYSDLERGPLSPPNWVFPVVWTVLYILLPVGTWLGWRLAAKVAVARTMALRRPPARMVSVAAAAVAHLVAAAS